MSVPNISISSGKNFHIFLMTAEASDLDHFLKVMLDPWLQAPRLLDDRNFQKKW